ncbi:MAG: tetratricopeptide repeat protein, partial [Planctomycetota bacterium]
MTTSSTCNEMIMIQSSLLIRIFSTIALTLWLSSCSQKVVKEEPPEPVIVEIQTETEPEIETSKIIDEHEYQQGIDALRARDFDKAKRLFGQFIQKNPSLSGAYLNLALIAYREEDYEKANRLVDQVIKLNPQQAPAYHLRAQLHLQNGKIKPAQQDYLKAIEIRPDYTNAHYNLALLYDIYLQELALAIEHYS